MPQPTIQITADLAELATAAMQEVLKSSRQAISQRGGFSFVLSGGNTPKTLFEKLATDPAAAGMDWSRTEVYFGDERCVPPDDAESNYRMAKLAMLDRVAIPPASVHRMRGEIDPQTAAIEYGRILQAKFGEGGPDLILLGMGDDGHTASLFPHTAALAEQRHRCIANFVPRLNTWRLTMSAPFINRAAKVIIMVSGAGKAERIAQVIEGPRDPQALPIQLIAPASGSLLWLLDRPAAARLSAASPQ
jgi:6-phosphogluconolactonase